MKILLTGATGFLGSRLLEHLSKMPEHQVGILVRDRSNIENIQDILVKTQDIFKIHSKESIDHAIDKFKPDIVIHIASMIRAEHQPDEVEPLVLSNILFPSLILESMRQHDVKYFINTGTFWEYLNSSSEYDPTSLYAATKRSFEDILRFYTEATDIRAVTLQLYDTYGPHDPRKKLLWWLRHSIDAQEAIPFSAGEQQMDMVYIDDIISAYTKAIEYIIKKQTKNIDIFPIATGEIHTLREVAQIFEMAIGKKLNIDWGKRPYRTREVMQVKPDLTNTKIKLGWQANITLEKGLEKIIEIDKI